LADDHPVVLNGLKSLIQTTSAFEIVAECSDGVSALRAIQSLQPDLALLDIAMPGLTGVEVLAAVDEYKLKTRIIFLTASADDSQIVEAVRRGAYGLVLKEAAADALLECMQAAMAGRRWLPPELVKPAMKREEERRLAMERIETALTPREREVVLLVAEGRSNKEIGKHISVTEGTVKIHLHNIYQKLSVGSRTALTALALNYKEQMNRKNSNEQ
jgi:two-component system nitrate/nitrite response regulator NarL